MTDAADVIENPITGERMTFLEPDPDSGERVLRIDMTVAPQGAVPAEHIHPNQEERFEVVAGRIEFHRAGEQRVVSAGERIEIPRGTPHVWANRSDEEARVLLEFTPPGQMRAFFENLFGLARDGKVDKAGQPNLLQCSVMAPEYDLLMAKPPPPVQRTLFALLRPIARARGYRVDYPEYRSRVP